MNWIIVASFLFFIIGINANINLQDIEIPDIDDVEVVKERCEKKGGKGTYEKVKEAKKNLHDCMQGFIDFDVVKNEIEEAKKTGSMDEVFGKYCAKRSIVKQCITSFTDAIFPCLEDNEKQALNLTTEILKQLGEFVCYRDGDRIAMFVAEGGVDCINQHTEGIKNCINSTFKINAQLSQNSLPSLLIDKSKCQEMGKLQTCVVEELEKCKDSTPANIVDALFRFIKRIACNSTNKSKRSIAHKLVKRSGSSLVESSYNRSIVEFKDRCLKNGGEDGLKRFEQAFENSKTCYKEGCRTVKVFIAPFDEFKSMMLNCTEEVTAAAKSCLSKDEQWFPELIRDIMISAMKTFYEHHEEIRRLTVNRRDFMQCLAHFKKAVENESGKEYFKSHDKNKIITKDEFCSDLTASITGLNAIMSTQCRLDESTARLKNWIMESIEAPCHKTA